MACNGMAGSLFFQKKALKTKNFLPSAVIMKMFPTAKWRPLFLHHISHLLIWCSVDLASEFALAKTRPTTPPPVGRIFYSV